MVHNVTTNSFTHRAFSFHWVVSPRRISPKEITGLKSNTIFMTIKISFQMAFKKIVKIYTARPATWPGSGGHEQDVQRCENIQHSI